MEHDCQYHCGDKITRRWHTFIFCFCRTAKVSHKNKFYSNPRFRGGDRIFRTLLLEYRCQLLNLLTVAIHIINPVDKTKLSYMLKACVPRGRGVVLYLIYSDQDCSMKNVPLVVKCCFSRNFRCLRSGFKTF